MIFNTALSGLNAASSELDVIGNNIANSSTVGFKGSRAAFTDIYTGIAYGAGSNAVGSGVRLSRVQQSFATGNLTSTGNTLDLAINGSGFFMLSDQGARVYTRAGQFKLNDSNSIVNGAGQFLQGIRQDGTFGNLTINSSNIAPKATTSVSVGANLNSRVGFTSTPPSSSDIPYVTLPWTGGASPAATSYNNVTSSTIYDSLGNSHVLSMYFIKGDSSSGADATVAGNPNEWYVAFQIDNQNVTTPAFSGANNSDNLYRLGFNADGSFKQVLDQTGTAVSPAGLVPITFTLANGAQNLSFNVDFSNSTQFGSPFAVQSLEDNGYTTGILSGLTIDASGTILGRYSNGQTPELGKIQLANFADPESLANLGNTTWAETAASGQPLISDGGAASNGAIESGSLEESNVDLTSQLVALISAQRNFQANAQTIKTGDAITQTIINIR